MTDFSKNPLKLSNLSLFPDWVTALANVPPDRIFAGSLSDLLPFFSLVLSSPAECCTGCLTFPGTACPESHGNKSQELNLKKKNKKHDNQESELIKKTNFLCNV